MTNGKMSKNSATWTAFIVGSLMIPFAPQVSHGQSVGAGSAIPELRIRSRTESLYVPEQSDSAENQGNSEPIQLGGEIDETSGEFDLNTQEGQRQQLSRNGNNSAGTQETQSTNRQRRARAAAQVGIDPDDPTSTTRANDPVDPVQTGTITGEEEDPFAPTGLRLGSFDVQLSLEQSVGYSNNVSRNAGGQAGAFSQTDLAASFTSDWSRHQWQTNLAGSYRKPFDSDQVDEPAFSADTELRLDLIDGVTVTGRGFYSATAQEFTDTTLAPGAVDTPLSESYGGSLAVRRADRRLVFQLRGAIQKDTFEDADLGGGVTSSQADQDSTLYSVSLRTGYEVSPAITPFVEGIYSIRDYDLTVDRNGNRRDSESLELRGGIEVDLGEKVQGEISAGYVNETFDDPLLEDLSGFTVNGRLNWSPERDSLVTITVGTETINSITANENGSLSYNGRIEYQRQVTDRLSVNGFAGVDIVTNDANNTTLSFGAGTQYWVNRFMALTTDVEYESFTSDVAGSDFDELSGRIGVRLQR